MSANQCACKPCTPEVHSRVPRTFLLMSRRAHTGHKRSQRNWQFSFTLYACLIPWPADQSTLIFLTQTSIQMTLKQNELSIIDRRRNRGGGGGGGDTGGTCPPSFQSVPCPLYMSCTTNLIYYILCPPNQKVFPTPL